MIFQENAAIRNLAERSDVNATLGTLLPPLYHTIMGKAAVRSFPRHFA